MQVFLINKSSKNMKKLSNSTENFYNFLIIYKLHDATRLSYDKSYFIKQKYNQNLIYKLLTKRKQSLIFLRLSEYQKTFTKLWVYFYLFNLFLLPTLQNNSAYTRYINVIYILWVLGLCCYIPSSLSTLDDIIVNREIFYLFRLGMYI